MAIDTLMTTCETIAPIALGPDGPIVGDAVTPGMADFLRGWAPATHATGKDEAESERVGRKIRAVPRQCWFNARKAVITLDDYAQASYVEGWAVNDNGFVIEHGWVVRGGVIIDPTLPASVGAYFPGLEFIGRSGIRAFLETPRGRGCRKSPFLFAFGWGGRESPSMARAYEQSLEHVGTIHRMK